MMGMNFFCLFFPAFFQDLLELRANQWVPRREENVPKTLQEVHNEALIKQYEDEMNITKPIPIRQTVDIKSKGAPLSTSPMSSSPGGEWTTVAAPPKKKNGKKKKKGGVLGSTSASPSSGSPAISPRGGDEVTEQRITDILDDYISSGDIQDTTAAVRELKAPHMLHKLVELGVALTLEKKGGDRAALSTLFTTLGIQEKLLLEEHFIRG